MRKTDKSGGFLRIRLWIINRDRQIRPEIRGFVKNIPPIFSAFTFALTAAPSSADHRLQSSAPSRNSFRFPPPTVLPPRRPIVPAQLGTQPDYCFECVTEAAEELRRSTGHLTLRPTQTAVAGAHGPGNRRRYCSVETFVNFEKLYKICIWPTNRDIEVVGMGKKHFFCTIIQ